MPIYRFKCTQCAAHYESHLPMRDMNNPDMWPNCPECESHVVKRLSIPSAPPPVIFRGDGFTKALE